MGNDLWPALVALGRWAERWMDVTTEHADPDVVLWSWCQEFLRRDLLPDRRVVVRFDFSFLGRPTKGWMLIEGRQADRRTGKLPAKVPGRRDTAGRPPG